MAMTKKHFIGLAKAIREIEPPEARRAAAHEIAYFCKSENYAFSFSRFYVACGLTDSGELEEVAEPVPAKLFD